MCFVYIVNLEFWKTVAKSQPGSLVMVAMSIRRVFELKGNFESFDLRDITIYSRMFEFGFE